MTRHMKRGGKVWITIFPDKPITSKPPRPAWVPVRATPEGWVAVVKPGRIMFEIAGVDDETAREALRLAITSCPSSVRSSLVKRRGSNNESSRDLVNFLPKTCR